MFYVIEIYDSGREIERAHFQTEAEARAYCEEFGWRTSEYSYLEIVEA